MRMLLATARLWPRASRRSSAPGSAVSGGSMPRFCISVRGENALTGSSPLAVGCRHRKRVRRRLRRRHRTPRGACRRCSRHRPGYRRSLPAPRIRSGAAARLRPLRVISKSDKRHGRRVRGELEIARYRGDRSGRPAERKLNPPVDRPAARVDRADLQKIEIDRARSVAELDIS